MPPCHEIDISCHKLSQSDKFVSKYPSSVAAILKLRFRDHMTPIFHPTPILGPGPQSSWALTWSSTRLAGRFWGTPSRHCEKFLVFTGPQRNFSLILLIIHKNFTSLTHFLSANVRGPISFAVFAQDTAGSRLWHHLIWSINRWWKPADNRVGTGSWPAQNFYPPTVPFAQAKIDWPPSPKKGYSYVYMIKMQMRSFSTNRASLLQGVV